MAFTPFREEADMSFKIAETTLASAVAASGTFTVGYPPFTDAGFFERTIGHRLWVDGHQTLYDFTDDFTLTFGTASITVTLGSALTTIPAGTRVAVQLDMMGVDSFSDIHDDSLANVAFGGVLLIELGTPDVLDADFLIKAATSTELPDTETVTYTPDTDGTTPTDGVGPVVVRSGVNYWELDVPRNLISTVTHGSSVVAMTIKIIGQDIYGATMSQTLTVAATGTSQVDVTTKAFKWVRSIAITAVADAEANTLNFGTGDVLGLPIRLPGSGHVLREMEDGAAPTAGAFVAAVDSAATATSGDVRGTYDANSACDGDLNFKLMVWGADPVDKGVAQFAG
jgi:hypothetical protein